jgi:hypothetical protein
VAQAVAASQARLHPPPLQARRRLPPAAHRLPANPQAQAERSAAQPIPEARLPAPESPRQLEHLLQLSAALAHRAQAPAAQRRPLEQAVARPVQAVEHRLRRAQRFRPRPTSA